MSDWYMAQLARQDEYGDEPPPPVQPAYDPWQRAAAAVRFGAKPLGGRQEGVATTLPENILFAAPRAAAGFTKAAFDRAAEEHGGVSQQSTDYDPRRMGAFLGAETALNTTGFGTPFSQAGALGSAGGKAVMGELASQAPPFYSAVERAVQGARQNTAPGQQWAGYLRNQPGVKPEEIEALKLGQLFEQPGAVPKQSVLDQIAANRVNVGEVVKGESVPTAFGTDVRTKHSKWVMPGGENYREMLLTLPYEKKGLQMREGETAVDALNRAQREHPAPFKSSHYDEPNILAHVRTNDRVIDGKKTLFVEEVQSDWHQAGRTKGYQGGDDTKLPTGWRVDRPDPTNHPNAWALFDGNGERGSRFWADSAEEATRLGLERNRNLGSKVPDAPFKTTWPELAMKRIIREAAEKGYDKVAWTPGSVQAARYDLSKQVDSIQVHPRTDAVTGEKTRSLLIQLPGGHAWSLGVNKEGIIDNVGASNQAMKGKRLDEVIGKDLADKIMATEGGAKLSGLDLQVGGEGMKGFYDEILPSTVNKLVKKHGGRVQQGQMDVSGGKPLDSRYHAENEGVERVHTIDITPSLREQAMKGFPLFTAGGIAATGVMGELARQHEYKRQ